MDAAHAAAVVLLAIAIDLAVGDPPNRYHPVAWMGAAIAAGQRRIGRGGPRWLFVMGAVLVIGIAAIAGAAGWLIAVIARAAGPAGGVIEAVPLAMLLSIRGLVTATRGVGTALDRGDLEGARRLVGMHLVSRPTRSLGAGHVASAAIESVAENLCDSVVAPVCFYVVFGLPGAALYRVLNTADAMIGYRDGELEYLGKAAARLDDVANLVPARLAALALVAGALGRSRAAFSVMSRDRRRTASPNAGWTMAAMAGALGVTLEKPGAYRLGDGPLPPPDAIELAIAIATRATALAVATVLALRWLAAWSG